MKEILLLEDDESLNRGISLKLSKEGYLLKIPLASVRMCHELVKLSRLENNMIRITPEPNSLIQTIREAVGQIYMKAHAKNIEICADMEEDAEILHDKGLHQNEPSAKQCFDRNRR